MVLGSWTETADFWSERQGGHVLVSSVWHKGWAWRVSWEYVGVSLNRGTPILGNLHIGISEGSALGPPVMLVHWAHELVRCLINTIVITGKKATLAVFAHGLLPYFWGMNIRDHQLYFLSDLDHDPNLPFNEVVWR